MKITHIELTDYGPYGGEVGLDLQTTDERPIILFGGKNGAGKTTLFNAIQLCLHGRSAFDSHISQQQYQEFLREKLHESHGEKATQGSIRLEFEYADFGETDTYAVERSFRDRGKSVVEDLSVRRNGSKLTELEEEQWDDFLKELIPPGISQLFFFDGEKVEDLASAIEEDKNFADSLVSLLGLDLVERLETDLGIYLSHKLDETGHEELASEINDLREQKSEFENEIETLESKIEQKRHRYEELSAEVDDFEQKLAEEGGTFAQKRDEYKDERARLSEKIETLEEDIRELARTEYPFALAPELCTQVIEQLETEVEAEQQAVAQAEAVSVLDDIADDEGVWSDFKISSDESDELVSRIQRTMQKELTPEIELDSAHRLAPQFSEREQQEMRTIVNRALRDVPDEMEQLTEELESATRQLQDVEEKISNAPEQSVLQPILSEINDRTSEQGQLKAKIKEHEERLETLENKHSRTESALEKKLEEQDELEDLSRRSELASKVQDVVREYRQRLVETKLSQLESALTDRYLRLTNKSQFFKEVRLNPDEMSFSIVTVGEDTKHQSQLSAGERQIFATAMLWALADISDRPLPFIIDTPLGRLDQEHRGNIVESFFPEAAHQVFLFSTDTEIVDKHYDTLRDSIAAEYHLANEETTGRTTVSPGYFETSESEAVQRSLDIQADVGVEAEKQPQVDFTKFKNV